MSSLDADIGTTASVPPPARRRNPWFRLGGIIAVLFVATWMVFGGYERLTAPNPRWKLPNGDTIEVLTFDNYYQGSYSLTGRGISGAHYLRLRFRSTLDHPARDRSDIRAAADIVCPMADSAGVRQLLIQPTRASFFDLISVSRDHVFRVMSGGNCEEISSGS
jgi:hypothetical protein